MRFNTTAFNSHLSHMGQQVNWRRSFSCACVSAASGQPDPKHALCAGKGRIWSDPIRTVVGVAGQKTMAEWAKSGLWDSGDVVLSVPENSALWGAGQFDRITLLNATDVFSMPLVRGAPNEKLLFTPVKIDRCFFLHAVTRTPVECGIPSVDQDGRLFWDGGDEPPPGAGYSITGTKYVEYYVFTDFPSNRNMHQGMRLPKRVVARRFDLFGR